MDLKMAEDRVKAILGYERKDGPFCLPIMVPWCQQLCKDWLTLRREVERLSEALAGMPCQNPQPSYDDKGEREGLWDAETRTVTLGVKDCLNACEPCKERLERAKREEK